MEDFSQVSWMGVIVGVVVAFLAGWIWYHPKTMGTKWAEGSGVDMSAPMKMPIMPMVSQLIALVFLALVVGITATTNALFTAIFAILACAMFVASSGSFAQKSKAAVMIDFGYIVIAGVVMIVFQGVF